MYHKNQPNVGKYTSPMDPMAKQNHTKKTPPNLRIAFTKAKVGPPEDIWSSANPLAVQQS